MDRYFANHVALTPVYPAGVPLAGDVEDDKWESCAFIIEPIVHRCGKSTARPRPAPSKVPGSEVAVLGCNTERLP